MNVETPHFAATVEPEKVGKIVELFMTGRKIQKIASDVDLPPAVMA